MPRAEPQNPFLQRHPTTFAERARALSEAALARENALAREAVLSREVVAREVVARESALAREATLTRDAAPVREAALARKAFLAREVLPAEGDEAPTDDRAETKTRVDESSEAAPSAVASPGTDKEALRNALDELEAAEARVERNAQRVYDETRAKLVSELLPVLDNLDRTVRAGRSGADSALVEGVEMVRNQLGEVLLRHGAERIQATGEKFDPALHHAIAMVHGALDSVGLVVEEVEAGYRFGGKVLRPAKVVVGAV